MRNYFWDPSGIISISSVVRISIASFLAFFTVVFANGRSKWQAMD